MAFPGDRLSESASQGTRWSRSRPRPGSSRRRRARCADPSHLGKPADQGPGKQEADQVATHRRHGEPAGTEARDRAQAVGLIRIDGRKKPVPGRRRSTSRRGEDRARRRPPEREGLAGDRDRVVRHPDRDVRGQSDEGGTDADQGNVASRALMRSPIRIGTRKSAMVMPRSRGEAVSTGGSRACVVDPSAARLRRWHDRVGPFRARMVPSVANGTTAAERRTESRGLHAEPRLNAIRVGAP